MQENSHRRSRTFLFVVFESLDLFDVKKGCGEKKVDEQSDVELLLVELKNEKFSCFIGTRHVA